jgi:Na+/H+ antiporter NhaD/arsenite permease-like protein
MRPPSAIDLAPFGLALVSLALLPSVASHLWEKRAFRLAWALVLVLPSVAMSGARGAWRPLAHAAGEYVDLVALLGSLFVISGGIALAGRLEGTPIVNTALLGIGTVLASFLGTPGAATLMIRPYLHANRRRIAVAHGVVFLIVLAGNIGGALLPIGDPPLYLGYLSGVPFFWTLSLWREWLFLASALLLVFFFWDLRLFRREGFVGEDETRTLGRIRVQGLVNAPILVAALASAVLLRGAARPAALAACAALSWWATPREVRERNRFTFEPVEEIAVIFLAIFGTIAPALELLGRHSAPFASARAYFWATGGFSAVLDNAPTYLSALESARKLPAAAGAAIVAGVREEILRAISLGAVFFGALTYIGNGPNLLVRSIAVSRGVKMPGFLRYTAIAGAILLPLFAVVTFVFL